MPAKKKPQPAKPEATAKVNVIVTVEIVINDKKFRNDFYSEDLDPDEEPVDVMSWAEEWTREMLSTPA